jgi:hypothetical protein
VVRILGRADTHLLLDGIKVEVGKPLGLAHEMVVDKDEVDDHVFVKPPGLCIAEREVS